MAVGLLCVCCLTSTTTISGVAVDGPRKEGNGSICLFKKTGKVKALDEVLCSKSESVCVCIADSLGLFVHLISCPFCDLNCRK